MESILKIGDKVRVGDRIGEVIRLDPKGSSTVIKVAFEEGPAKDFVCPPTKVEKILSPIEQIENNKFDSAIHFDLHLEAATTSETHDAKLMVSRTRGAAIPAWPTKSTHRQRAHARQAAGALTFE